MWSVYRYNSRGYNKDPPAHIHSQILFGPGEYLTPEFVEKYKITHVINCAQEEFSPSWFKQNNPTKYFCLNSIDSYDVEILSWYPKFKEIMNKFLNEMNENPIIIYVHCQAGMNRSGFLYLAFLVFEYNYNIEKLELSIIKQRPCALQNIAFRREIYDKYKEFILYKNYN